jgi:hypothetical protein
MAATVNINFIVSDVRKREIEAAASARETTVSAWLREAIREKLDRDGKAA